MKQLVFITGLALLLCAATCDNGNQYQLGEPIRLELGGRATSPHDVMQFVSVTEDSRCPEYTNCIWEGQVGIQLSIGKDGRESVKLALHPEQPEAAQQSLGGYIYRLQKVEPYPKAGQNIRMEDYVITVVVEAI